MISPKKFCAILLVSVIVSCSPKIYSFSANPKIITENDSVHLSWNVRGTPGITYHQKKVRYLGADSLQLLQFILISTAGARVTSPTILEIPVLPKLYRDILIFPVVSRHGDTLMANGIRDSMYLNFKIESMASVNDRKMLVQHDVYQTMLYDSSKKSKSLQGLDYAGPWILQSLLTPDERANPKLVPDHLMIAVFIKPKKP
ncbi:MAG TPA: hypothetical protein VGI38_05255 [Puia sp.]|jgi:hypothetical protein